MARSPVGVSGPVSVAELLVRVGSLTPSGATTVAELVRVPVAVALTVAAMVKVTDSPDPRLTGALIEPEPDGGQVAPPVPVQVHVAPLMVAGRVSVTVAPTTALGPLLVAVTRYVTVLPGTMVGFVRVLVIARSARLVTVPVDVAVLLATIGSVVPAGGVTVAVLFSGPARVDGAMVPVTVIVAVVPTGRVTGSEIALPVPLAVLQEAPAPVVAQLQATPVMATGTLSVITALVAMLGPLLPTVIV